MDYVQLRRWFNNRNAILNGYNSADGTTTDGTTDAVITRDPNDYLVPTINGFTVVNTLKVIVAVLAIIVLLPMAIKNIKQFI